MDKDKRENGQKEENNSLAEGGEREADGGR